MHTKRPNTVVIIMLLLMSLTVTFFEVLYKGLISLITGNMQPMRQTRLLKIWHWVALDGPKKFWAAPTWYHAMRSLATLIEVVLYPKKK